MKAFYRIESPYFVVGVLFDNNVVIDVPPIVKYIKGWQLSKVMRYCTNKQWKLEKIHED